MEYSAHMPTKDHKQLECSQRKTLARMGGPWGMIGVYCGGRDACGLKTESRDQMIHHNERSLRQRDDAS